MKTPEELNNIKIKFCNAFDRMTQHLANDKCEACAIYLKHGDGDLCQKGKDLVILFLEV